MVMVMKGPVIFDSRQTSKHKLVDIDKGDKHGSKDNTQVNSIDSFKADSIKNPCRNKEKLQEMYIAKHKLIHKVHRKSNKRLT